MLYRAPTSLAEAVDILRDPGDDAKLVAGGPFYFCSAGCRVEFEREPTNYLNAGEA